MTVYLCCEGSSPCNAGHSALVREAAIVHDLPGATCEMRDEAEKHARTLVSKQLAVTPHVRVSTTRRGGVAFALFACAVCSHERVYGNSGTFQP